MFGKRLLKAARLGVPLSLIPFQLQSLRNKHPSPRLIVFTGKIGAGKTTASEWLSKHHGYQEVAFASPLKRMMEVFGFSKQQLYGSQHDKETIIHPHLGVTMREFAQKFGTDLVRDSLPELIPPLKAKLQNQSIWTRLAEMSILSLFQQRKDVVVSDARFPDEIDMLRRHGAVIIRIYRPDDLIGFMETATAAEAYSPALRIHKSETAIDHERVDFTIMNNQTQIDFYSELDKIIKSLPTYVFDRYFVSFPFPSYINNAPFLQVGGVSCAGIAIYRALYLNGEPRATCTYKQHKYKHRWIWTANVHTRGLKPLYTGEKCVPKVYIEGAESTVEKLQSILFEIAPLGIKDTTLGIVPTQLDSYGYAPIEVQTDDEKDIRRIEHFLATKDVTLCFRSKHWPLSREWVPFFYFHKTHYVNLIDKRFYTCNGMERSLNNR